MVFHIHTIGKSSYSITTLSLINQLPEDDYCMPKHVGGVSYVNKVLYFYCFAVVRINMVYEPPVKGKRCHFLCHPSRHCCVVSYVTLSSQTPFCRKGDGEWKLYAILRASDVLFLQGDRSNKLPTEVKTGIVPRKDKNYR